MSSSSESPHVRRIAELIEARYDRPVSVTDLSRILRRQASYLSRLFRQQRGCGIHAYLVRTRMQRAAELLRRGERVEAVALLVGYKSKTNFYRQFKRHFGVTPAALRDSRG
jgi:AraC-like DNA-binding protein